MSDLISRQAVLAIIEREEFKGDAIAEIEKLPSVENKEEWIDGDPICPCCGEDKFKGLEADIYADWQPNFCPNCGADMRKPIIDEKDIPMEYFESGGK